LRDGMFAESQADRSGGQHDQRPCHYRVTAMVVLFRLM
jgi:hypothetical protein